MKWLLYLIPFIVSMSYAAPLQLTFASNEKASEQVIAGCILTEIYRLNDISITVIPMPANLASLQNQNKKVNGEVARISAYKAKDPNLLKVKPAYYYLNSTAFFKSSKDIKKLNDLNKYKIGIVRGVAHAELLVKDMSNVDFFDDYTQLFVMLEADKIDVAIDTSVNGKYMIHKLRIADIINVELIKHDLFNVLNSTTSSIAERISKTIIDLQTDGRLNKTTQSCEEKFFKKAQEFK